MTQVPRTVLHSLDDVKRHFAQGARPWYFVGATNFNVMGLHEWVAGWHNINLLDCFDGHHPKVLVAGSQGLHAFAGAEDVNHHLMGSDQVSDWLAQQRAAGNEAARVLFMFFDPGLEATCRRLGLELALPDNQLVRHIDSKLVTTEIGNEAGVPSVPNVLTRVSSYAALTQAAHAAGLGDRWVVQTAYGDSGRTTFFIDSESDYQAVAGVIEAQERVKVMRRIRCMAAAIEGCATRWGTFVGPLLTELIGDPALTPYRGGWCGNELRADALSLALRRQVQARTIAMGEALYRRGYRGTFELDILIDLDSGDIWLGELNSRITGISALTNMSDVCTEHLPVFLFHLLEYDPAVDLKIDVAAYNEAVLHGGAGRATAQVILKSTDQVTRAVASAPASGVYVRGSDGRLRLKETGYTRRAALADDEAYVLRILSEGQPAVHGGDLAIMFVNQPIFAADATLNPIGQDWVAGLRACFSFRELTDAERAGMQGPPNLGDSKRARGP